MQNMKTSFSTITKLLIPRPLLNRKWPLSQNWLVNNIIYKTILTSAHPNHKEKINFGAAETLIKLQYLNYQRSFKFLKYKTDNELSNKV